jgi:hypothetical protein
VAAWLEGLSEEAGEHLARMEAELADPATPEARRLIVDVAIQAAIGRFFAGTMRAATLYDVGVRTGSGWSMGEAMEAYRGARAAWAEAAERAAGVYVDDLTYGPQPWLRGTWSDRLPAIDRDVEAMAATASAAPRLTAEADAEARRILFELSRGSEAVVVTHAPPPPFRRGEPITLVLDVGGGDPASVGSVSLRYRHLDQSKVYTEVEMTAEGDRYAATVPGDVADSPFPLLYRFVLRDGEGGARLHPGLGPELSDQPYYVLRQESSGGGDRDRPP